MTWEIVVDAILTIALLLLLGIEYLLVIKAWNWAKKRLGFKIKILQVEQVNQVAKK